MSEYIIQEVGRNESAGLTVPAYESAFIRTQDQRLCLRDLGQNRAIVATVVVSNGYRGPLWDFYPSTHSFGKNPEAGIDLLIGAAKRISNAGESVYVKIRPYNTDDANVDGDRFSSQIAGLLTGKHGFLAGGTDSYWQWRLLTRQQGLSSSLH